MATTTDLAPTRKPRNSRASSKAREAQLEEQVSRLQSDLKSIGATLTRLTNEKVDDVRETAKDSARNLQRQGQHVVEEVQDQASAMEQQLKDTIREKPLTAVASAVGVGFLLALLMRH